MIFILICALLVAVLYVGAATWIRKELPDSISAIVYCFSRPWQWVWIVWLWFQAFALCIPSIEVLPDKYKVIGMATLTCLCFCGAMPLCRREANTLHDVFGIAAGVGSQVIVLILQPAYLFGWLLVFILFIPRLRPKYVLVAEFICWANWLSALFPSAGA